MGLVAGQQGAHDGGMTIEPGMLLEATTASGSVVLMRATGRPEKGRDFPVVWVCTEEEYERSQEAGDEPDALPWPLSAIRVPEHA